MTSATTMTETATFDTLSTAKGLQQAGFNRKQAEALALAMASALAKTQGNLATKEDIAALKADIAELKAANRVLEERIAANRTLILYVMVPFHLATMIAVMSLVLKAFLG